jgi:hypothetical protein
MAASNESLEHCEAQRSEICICNVARNIKQGDFRRFLNTPAMHRSCVYIHTYIHVRFINIQPTTFLIRRGVSTIRTHNFINLHQYQRSVTPQWIDLGDVKKIVGHKVLRKKFAKLMPKSRLITSLATWSPHTHAHFYQHVPRSSSISAYIHVNTYMYMSMHMHAWTVMRCVHSCKGSLTYALQNSVG